MNYRNTQNQCPYNSRKSIKAMLSIQNSTINHMILLKFAGSQNLTLKPFHNSAIYHRICLKFSNKLN